MKKFNLLISVIIIFLQNYLLEATPITDALGTLVSSGITPDQGVYTDIFDSTLGVKVTVCYQNTGVDENGNSTYEYYLIHSYLAIDTPLKKFMLKKTDQSFTAISSDLQTLSEFEIPLNIDIEHFSADVCNYDSSNVIIAYTNYDNNFNTLHIALLNTDFASSLNDLRDFQIGQNEYFGQIRVVKQNDNFIIAYEILNNNDTGRKMRVILYKPDSSNFIYLSDGQSIQSSYKKGFNLEVLNDLSALIVYISDDKIKYQRITTDDQLQDEQEITLNDGSFTLGSGLSPTKTFVQRNPQQEGLTISIQYESDSQQQIVVGFSTSNPVSDSDIQLSKVTDIDTDNSCSGGNFLIGMVVYGSYNFILGECPSSSKLDLYVFEHDNKTRVNKIVIQQAFKSTLEASLAIGFNISSNKVIFFMDQYSNSQINLAKAEFDQIDFCNNFDDFESKCNGCSDIRSYLINGNDYDSTQSPVPDPAQYEDFYYICHKCQDSDQYVKITKVSADKCDACTFPCSSCFTSPTDCDSCVDNAIKVSEDSNTCICNTGYFEKDDNCELCDIKCETCSSSKTFCTKCKNGGNPPFCNCPAASDTGAFQIPVYNANYKPVPDSYVPSDDYNCTICPSKCSVCDPDTVLCEKCTGDDSTGDYCDGSNLYYYPNYNESDEAWEYLKCSDKLCAKCDKKHDDSEDKCTLCVPNSSDNAGDCQCDEGYYTITLKNDRKNCQKCPYYCKTCSSLDGGSNIQCDSCFTSSDGKSILNRSVSKDDNCACNSNYIPRYHETYNPVESLDCLPIPDTCVQSSDPNFDESDFTCTNGCTDGSENLTCKNTTNMSFYPVVDTKTDDDGSDDVWKFEECAEKCFTCENDTECTGCDTDNNWEFDGIDSKNCVCIDKYFQNTDNENGKLQCSACEIQCDSCFNQSHLCTQCASATNRQTSFPCGCKQNDSSENTVPKHNKKFNPDEEKADCIPCPIGCISCDSDTLQCIECSPDSNTGPYCKGINVLNYYPKINEDGNRWEYVKCDDGCNLCDLNGCKTGECQENSTRTDTDDDLESEYWECVCNSGYYRPTDQQDCQVCPRECATCDSAGDCETCKTATGRKNSPPDCGCEQYKVERYHEIYNPTEENQLDCIDIPTVCNQSTFDFTGNNLFCAGSECDSVDNCKDSDDIDDPFYPYFDSTAWIFKECHKRCASCTGENIDNCLSCYGESGDKAQFRELVGSECICMSKDSENKKYFDGGLTTEASNKCTECPHECKTCKFDSDEVKCAECKEENLLDSRTLVKNCECGPGYVERDGDCILCPEECSECANEQFGEGENIVDIVFCKICHDPFKKLPFCQIQYDQSEGLSQYVTKNNYQLEFQQCANMGCICQESSDNCVECQGANRQNIDNNCVCINDYVDTNNKLDESNNLVSSQNQIDCYMCELPCLTCHKPGICQTCKENDHRILGDDMKCGCDTGYILSQDGQSCIQCPSECVQCVYNESEKNYECSGEKCADDSVIDENKCLLSDSNKYSEENDSGELEYLDCQLKKCESTCSSSGCDGCEAGSNRSVDPISGNCVCDNGYFENNDGDCEECSFPCQNCTSSTTCTSCKTNDPYIKQEVDEGDGSVSCICQEGYTYLIDLSTTNQDDNKCTKCPHQCKTCNENGCTACKDPRKSGKYCTDQDDNYAKFFEYVQADKQHIFKNCKIFCETCVDENSCLTCKTTNVNHRQTDVQNCPCESNQQYYDDESLDCQRCESPCDTCNSDGTTCLTCLDDHKEGNDCNQCKDNHIELDLEDGSKACYTCPSECDECELDGDKLICSACQAGGTTPYCQDNVSVDPQPFYAQRNDDNQSFTIQNCLEQCKSCVNDQECEEEHDCSGISGCDLCKSDSECISCTGQYKTGPTCTCQVGYVEYHPVPDNENCYKCPEGCVSCRHNGTDYICEECVDSNDTSVYCQNNDLKYYSILDEVTKQLQFKKCNLGCNNGCSRTDQTCIVQVGQDQCKGNNRDSSNDCICNAGYHDDNNNLENCIKCEFPCITCSTQNNCLTCVEQDNRDDTVPGPCGCSSGAVEILNESNEKICILCPDECETCDKNKCLSCKDNNKNPPHCTEMMNKAYYHSVNSEYTKIEINECDYNCMDCVTSGACSSCKGENREDSDCSCTPGFYDFGTEINCQRCPFPCETCNSDGSCITCQQAQGRPNSQNNDCSCLPGFVAKDSETLTCDRCPLVCETCDEITRLCKVCANPDLKAPYCSENNTSYFVEYDSDSAEYSYTACQPQCASCTDESANCVQKVCEHPCQTCSLSKTHCLTCVSETGRPTEQSEVCGCLDGYVEDGIDCVACPQDCATCDKKGCITCAVDERIPPFCQDSNGANSSLYQEFNSQTQQLEFTDCKKNCKTCDNGTSCTSCLGFRRLAPSCDCQFGFHDNNGKLKDCIQISNVVELVNTDDDNENGVISKTIAIVLISCASLTVVAIAGVGIYLRSFRKKMEYEQIQRRSVRQSSSASPMKQQSQQNLQQQEDYSPNNQNQEKDIDL